MKKLFTFLFMLVSVACYGEIISEVRFNPSRMGEYDYLKVSQKATLAGGLNVTDEFNIQSASEVIMYLGDSAATHFQVNDKVIGDADSTIDMTSAVFKKSAGGVIDNVVLYGGIGEFNGALSNNPSTANKVVGANTTGGEVLLQKAETFSGGKVTITGEDTSKKLLHDGGSTKGFLLAGVDIPTPVDAGLDGASSISDCELAWEKRTLAGSSDRVQVLALKCDTVSGTDGPGGGSGGGGGSSSPCSVNQTRSVHIGPSPCGLGANISCSAYDAGLTPSGCNCDVLDSHLFQTDGGGFCYYDITIKIH